MKRAIFLLLALTQALRASGQEQQDHVSDRVTISAIDPFQGYPAASKSPRGESVVYVVDMATALGTAQGATVAMTWRSEGTTHEICFEHAAERRCRMLDATWNSEIDPRFKPTKSDHWPTVYASFTHKDGRSSLIVYAAGAIKTNEEEIAELRVRHGAPQ